MLMFDDDDEGKFGLYLLTSRLALAVRIITWIDPRAALSGIAGVRVEDW